MATSDAVISLEVEAPLPHRALHPGLARLLPEPLARLHGLVPIGMTHDLLEVAVFEPIAPDRLAALERELGCRLTVVAASRPEWGMAVERVYGQHDADRARGAAAAVLAMLNQTGVINASQAEAFARDFTPAGPAGLGPVADLPDVPPEAIAEVIGLLTHLPWLDGVRGTVQTPLAVALSEPIAERLQAVPFRRIGTGLLVATWLPPDVDAWLEAEAQTGYRLSPVIFPPATVRAALAWAATFRESVSVQTELDPQYLLDAGVVTAADIRLAQEVARRSNAPLDDVLRRTGAVSASEMARARATQFRRVFHPASQLRTAATALVPVPTQRALGVAITALHTDVATMTCEGEPSPHLLQLLQLLIGRDVRVTLCERGGVAALLDAVERPTTADATANRLLSIPRLPGEAALDILSLPQPAGPRPLDGDPPPDVGEEDWVAAVALARGVPHVLAHRWRLAPPPNESIVTLAEHAGAVAVGAAGLVDVIAVTPSHYSRVAALLAEAVTGERSMRLILSTTAAVQSAVRQRRGSRPPRPVPAVVDDLGRRLVRDGVLPWAAWTGALQRYADQHEPLDRALVHAGLAPVAIAEALVSFMGVALARLEPFEESQRVLDAVGRETVRYRVVHPVDPFEAARLSASDAEELGALPYRRDAGRVVVAVADPLSIEVRAGLEARINAPIQLEVVDRPQLMGAIQRTLRRRSVGDVLLDGGMIDVAQLRRAIDLQRQSGVRLGRALVSLGVVNDEQLALAVAEQSDLPYVDIADLELDRDAATLLSSRRERDLGLLPLAVLGDEVVVAMVDPLDDVATEEVRRTTGKSPRPVVCSEQSLEAALERLYSDDYLAESASALMTRRPDDSARRVLSRPQAIVLAVAAVSIAAALFTKPIVTLLVLNTMSLIFYLSFSVYKFYLIYRALAHSLEIPVAADDVADLDDRQLPLYTVLVPLYREPEVLPQLVRSIAALDYPETKLDIKLLLEEDDEETITAARGLRLPAHFQLVLIPPSEPRGKPKACNYGLLHARGAYCVIYDAEDVPDADQLKRVLVAFSKSAPEVVCIQCKLNYYNRNQNLLTRWFTNEYSMWFDLFLPGLDASGAPIPLGGTSNHFVTRRLQELAAWDPHNVTEDADLGVRLFKAGWKTAVVDSTTYEEANSQVYNWIRQRSRWVKGYVQTYLVHMRHPVQLWRALGPSAFFSFQMVIGGTFFGFLVNPVYWLLTTLWYVSGWYLIRAFFPPAIFYFSAIGLYFGNFAFTYMNVAGALRRRHYDMVKYALISPLYWALMSIAAWKGFLQLFYAPSYWEKTRHGLYRGPVTGTEERQP